MIEDPDDVSYVRWRGGIWKVIESNTQTLRVRWVRGYKPNEGVFQIVRPWDTTVLTAMEVLGLMADDEVVP